MKSTIIVLALALSQIALANPPAAAPTAAPTAATATEQAAPKAVASAKKVLTAAQKLEVKNACKGQKGKAHKECVEKQMEMVK